MLNMHLKSINIFILLLVKVVQLQLQFEQDESNYYPLTENCESIRTCQKCKSSELECEWCHNYGCTKFPHVRCPKKILLAHLFNRNNETQPACTRIVTKSPVFVPANVRHIIKLELEIDDMMLFIHKVLCEIQIEGKVMQVQSFVKRNALFCDPITLKTTRGVALGSVRLLMESVVPYSNKVLIIAYNCHILAENYNQCQVLNKRFNCVWCRMKARCALTEDCPSNEEPWFGEGFNYDNSLDYV